MTAPIVTALMCQSDRYTAVNADYPHRESKPRVFRDGENGRFPNSTRAVIFFAVVDLIALVGLTVVAARILKGKMAMSHRVAHKMLIGASAIPLLWITVFGKYTSCFGQCTPSTSRARVRAVRREPLPHAPDRVLPSAPIGGQQGFVAGQRQADPRAPTMQRYGVPLPQPAYPPAPAMPGFGAGQRQADRHAPPMQGYSDPLRIPLPLPASPPASVRQGFGAGQRQADRHAPPMQGYGVSPQPACPPAFVRQGFGAGQRQATRALPPQLPTNFPRTLEPK